MKPLFRNACLEYDKLKTLFEEKLGGVGLAEDVNALGNGIFALEGDGKLEVGSSYECWAVGGTVVVVLEKEKDNDVNAYVTDAGIYPGLRSSLSRVFPADTIF